MMKENVLEIKKLVGDLHCMGTYGMVELELTKIENYVKELEGKVKNLTIPRVSNSVYCECVEKEVLMLPHSNTPYCAECGKNIKQ
jgi:hypothetical protein